MGLVGVSNVSDAEHAVASAGLHSNAAVDELDGGVSDAEIEAWMETAVEPAGSATDDTADPEA